MCGLENCQGIRVVMTRQAGIGTLAGVFRLLATDAGDGANQEQNHRNINRDSSHPWIPDPGLVEIELTNAMHRFHIR